MEELNNYYNLDEVLDLNLIVSKLKKLKKEGKIDFEIDQSILKLVDIDLDMNEVKNLIDLFERNDIFPNVDIEEDDDDDEYNIYSEDDDYNDNY